MEFLKRWSEPIYAITRIVVGFLFLCHGLQKLHTLATGAESQMPAGMLWAARVRPEQVRQALTLGVDERTNSLVVSADDSLFKQVESLVKSLDESALEANRTIRVVDLQNANSVVVQQALGSLIGKVKVTTTGNGTSGTQPQSSGSPFGQRGSDGRSGSDDATRQFFEQRMRERMMQGSGGFGGSRDGGSRGGEGRGGEGRRSEGRGGEGRSDRGRGN